MSTNAYRLQYAQDGSMLYVAHLKRRICWITAEESKKFPREKNVFFSVVWSAKAPRNSNNFTHLRSVGFSCFSHLQTHIDISNQL